MRKKKKTYDLRIEDMKGKVFTIARVREYASDKERGHLYYRKGGELKYIRFRELKVFENVE